MMFLYWTIATSFTGIVVLLAEELSDDKQMYADQHNILRSKVDPPAGNMKKLEKDLELETLAKEWASNCVFKSGHSKNNYKGVIGQNLFWSTNRDDIVDDAIKAWNSQAEHYYFDSNSCETDHVCGSYTQLVWANSYKIGCGLSDMCDDGSYIFVCYYSPAGNYVGQKPYKNGTSCSTCAVGWKECSDNLCSKKLVI